MGQGRATGVALSSGRLLLTTWRPYFTGINGTSICIIGSDDNGASWSRMALIENTGEAALSLLPDNKTVYLNARHCNCGEGPYGRTTGYSADGGKTWKLEYNTKSLHPHFGCVSMPKLLQNGSQNRPK